MSYEYKIDVPNEVRQLYRESLQEWGLPSLIDQVIEECAELILVLQHLKRTNKSITLEDIAGEAADVRIVVDRLMFSYLGREFSEEWVNKKLDKLERCIDERREKKDTSTDRRTAGEAT